MTATTTATTASTVSTASATTFFHSRCTQRRRSLQRRHVLALAALFALVDVVSFAARAESAAPVRVAVAGVQGQGLPPETLPQLAGAFRSELARRADARVFTVVSRDEMSAVYDARGGACSPDDAPCIVAASAGWSGRLFARGRIAQTPKGLVFTLSLDSVRGFHVADAGAPIKSPESALLAIPALVDALLAKEKVFRAKMTPASSAAAPAEQQPAWARFEAPVATAVATAAAAPSTEELDEDDPDRHAVICHASPNGYIAWGSLVIDADGLRYSSKMLSKWARAWPQLRSVKGTMSSAMQPAIMLMPSQDTDVVFLWFESAAERDRCLNAIDRQLQRHHTR